ncbi:FAD-dependent oxidoreductase [Methanospirillum sp. J.3.6.1-F.2.7.3]|uniref:FAD-dependent oxidoreductase n=1 Tax=Methanospirillum purgamenti TaxID=2834276 RepID=A0A8E7B1A0_9EURY|nr:MULTISPECIES: FAD-dependent oxidoreductase [Methanospirillum]MDX8549502.1 FAD-dependent oxidoreductase [Methanospirillum hungatei]QVV89216.1 FAD-dependent oxidoreductase [Methanospirillum sp. J.3.6.1-F.2.7.3]
MKYGILGGGLTGVTLGRMLSESGHDVVVLEKEKRIGGLCKSLVSDGYTFDEGGSHIIFSRDTEVLNFMKSVLNNNRAERTRNTCVLYKGIKIKYPFENGLYNLPKEDLFFCLYEYIKTLIAEEKGEIPPPKTFRDWIYKTFGKGIADSYLIPYNEKIWNFPTEQMSAHWMEGRVPRPPMEDIIRSAIGIETEGYTHQSSFSYPIHGGIEALITAIALPIKDNIKTNCSVCTLKKNEDGWIIQSQEETISVDHIISTIPLQYLLPCLSNIPTTVQEACRELHYNSLISVCIGFKGEVPPISWMYIPDNDTGLFNRISFPSNYSTAVSPTGHSSLLAEITYNEGDTTSALTDKEIIAHCISKIISIGLIPDKKSINHSSVHKSKYAYVVYDINYKKNVGVVRNYLQNLGINLVGRFSEFEYLNMDGCIRSAMRFVETID